MTTNTKSKRRSRFRCRLFVKGGGCRYIPGEIIKCTGAEYCGAYEEREQGAKGGAK